MRCMKGGGCAELTVAVTEAVTEAGVEAREEEL